MDINADGYMNDNGSAWNAEDVQSSGGGVVFAPDGEQLFTYVSGRNQRMQKLQTGMLSLRRDGYASLDAAALSSQAVYFTTRPVRWDGALKFLFVNYNSSALLRVEVRDSVTGAPIEPFTLGKCIGVRGDTTRSLVSWAGAPTDALAAIVSRGPGKAVVLHFEWAGGSLFSFWLSGRKSCGESRGYAAAGGPGMIGGRDMNGACAG